MNIIKAMAEQERALVKNIRLDEKDNWIENFIRKELKSEAMQYEAITEPLGRDEIQLVGIFQAYMENDSASIGEIIYRLINKYMHDYAEREWQYEVDDINFPKD